ARQASLLYRRQGGSWDLVCSSLKRGRSSGEAFLSGDLKPGSRERLPDWQSLTTPSHLKLYVGNISFTYLPYVTIIPNNLGVLDSAQNRWGEARMEVSEVLKIYRNLRKKIRKRISLT